MTFDKWCKSQEMNNAELAAELDVSANYVSMLRCGRRLPSSALMIIIYDMSDGSVNLLDWRSSNDK